MVDSVEGSTAFDSLEKEAEGEQVAAVSGEVLAADVVATSEILMPIVGVGFSVIAPAWDLTAEEVGQLSECYAALIDKYYPEGLGKIGVELNAALITAAIIAPRLGTARKIEKSGGEEVKAPQVQNRTSNPIKENGVNQI